MQSNEPEPKQSPVGELPSRTLTFPSPSLRRGCCLLTVALAEEVNNSGRSAAFVFGQEWLPYSLVHCHSCPRTIVRNIHYRSSTGTVLHYISSIFSFTVISYIYTLNTIAASTAFCQPAYSRSLCSSAIPGSNIRSDAHCSHISSRLLQNPTARPAR